MADVLLRDAEPQLCTDYAEPILAADIETVVQWALSRTGKLPWSNPRDEELSLDRGLTAQPKRKPRGSWLLVYACAGLKLGGHRPIVPVMSPGTDAAMVIEAIKRLPAEQASAVLMFARAARRPDWIENPPGPRPIYRQGSKDEVKIIRHKGSGRKKRNVPPYCPLYWPLDPEAICAARRAYSLWHAGLTRLCAALSGQLKRWPSIGFDVSSAPWERV